MLYFALKVKVQVSVVADRFCVARTFETFTVNVGGTGIDITRVFVPPKIETRVQTLRTQESTWDKLEERQSFVKTGDLARQIPNADYGTGVEDQLAIEPPKE